VAYVLFQLDTGALRDWVAGHGVSVVLIVVTTLAALKLIGRIIPPAIRRAVLSQVTPATEYDLRKRADTLTAVLLGAARAAVLVVATLMIMGELGINVVPVIAGLGIGGIAIGLGAQSLVRDAINGILILTENQFGRGDMIKVAGVQGWVEEVNLRRTVLRDIDGTLHSVPNSEIKVSSNLTRGYSGVDLLIAIAAGQDIDAAIDVINRVGRDLGEEPEMGEEILEAPRVVRVENVSAATVDLRVAGRVVPGSQYKVASALRQRIVKAFGAGEIRFGPMPAPPPSPPPTAPVPPP